MTQIPADWYPDPAPQTAPGRLRYWDGQGWTEHVHDPQAHPPAYPQGYPPAYPQGYGQPAPHAAPRAAPTTPDGQALSGWWRRVLALIVDNVIQGFLIMIALIPVLIAQWGQVRDWFDRAASSDRVETPNLSLFGTSGWQVAVLAILVVVPAVYTLAFWHWKQATPGKLLVGVRIRRRDEPGPMPWGTMIARYAFVAVLNVAGYAPRVGLLFAIVALLDYLWPLWDSRNQALHDKVAGTNVVLATPGPSHGLDPATAAALPPRW